MILSLLISFGITIAAEIAAALVWGIRQKSVLLIIFLANVITNPPLVYVVNLLHMFDVAMLETILLLLELAAVAVEALIYRYALGWGKKGLFFSIGLNSASFILGTAVQFILKWV